MCITAATHQDELVGVKPDAGDYRLTRFRQNRDRHPGVIHHTVYSNPCFKGVNCRCPGRINHGGELIFQRGSYIIELRLHLGGHFRHRLIHIGDGRFDHQNIRAYFAVLRPLMLYRSMVGQCVLQCGFEIGINVACQAVTVVRCEEVICDIAQVVVSIRIRFATNPVGPVTLITNAIDQPSPVPKFNTSL